MSQDLNPAVLAQPGSGFQFPAKQGFSLDRDTSELRMLIIGWLKQAEMIATANGGIQELREAVFRVTDLTIALSAREIAKHLQEKPDVTANPARKLNGKRKQAEPA